MLVAAGQVYFRDLKNFLPYVLRIWLYSSPILYYADRGAGALQVAAGHQPDRAAAGRLERRCFDLGRAPDANDLLLGLGWGVALFLIGAPFFISREREFAVRL